MRNGSDSETRAAFDLFHPAVALAYFAALLVLSMAAMQPVYLLLAFAGSLGLACALGGPRAAGRALRWQLPVIALLAAANLLLSPSGSTELFRIGARAFYLESLAYGACMGLMLATVLLVFSNASRVLTSDKVMALFGNLAPTLGLMLSMVARLVPQFVRRGQDVGGVQRACTAARPGGKAAASGRGAVMRDNLRLSSVLMGWGMEDSLETADAMKARGWGAAVRSTTYSRYRFRPFDAAVLACVVALVAASSVAAWAACARFEFYPKIGGLAPWWSYAPFALYVALPLVMEARERMLWKS